MRCWRINYTGGDTLEIFKLLDNIYFPNRFARCCRKMKVQWDFDLSAISWFITASYDLMKIIRFSYIFSSTDDSQSTHTQRGCHSNFMDGHDLCSYHSDQGKGTECFICNKDFCNVGHKIVLRFWVFALFIAFFFVLSRLIQ